MTCSSRRVALWPLWAVTASLCGLFAPVARAQVSVDIQVSSERSFVPLQSYEDGETGDSLIFFGGLTDMGLHALGEGAFPLKNFNTNIYLVKKSTGAVHTASTLHLSDSVREALRVTAPTSVQFGDTLYLFGGYGLLLDNVTYTTQSNVTAIDLAAVESAILADQPVPESAFTVMPSSVANVAGAGILKFSDGERFALVCGADVEGEYSQGGFDPHYANAVHFFDRTVSVTEPTWSITDEELSPLHRRDVNVLPVTLPDGGGVRDGFVVVCGAFENGIFLYENPLIWADGDAEVFEDNLFTQHIGAYEGPTVSFYSAANDTNLLLNCSGLSGYDYINGEFVWNPAAPWTDAIGLISITSGMFTDEAVVGQMPWPTTNAHLIVEDGIPTNAMGQVLFDELPLNQPVLIGRIYGGIAAESTGDQSPTWASDDVLDVFVTVEAEVTETFPQSFERVRGLPVGTNGLEALLASDDDRLTTRPDVFGPAPLNNPAVQVELVATSPVESPRQIAFTLESLASRSSILQRIWLFNYATGEYEMFSSQIVPTTDTVFEVAVDGSPADYVEDGTREMRALVQHVGMAFNIAPTWNAGLDLARWDVVE